VHSFVIICKPKSYNSWGSASVTKKSKYKNLIEKSFRDAYPAHILLEDDLYGLVYHFFQRDIGIDADNLSKPIWDCLRGILFDDDKRVKMRIAGSFDLTANDLTILDFSGLPGTVIASLLEVIETEEHVIYIECGTFTTEMIRLNLERNGN
jgi:Holliday junction resolvase RusA-like endonuclease